MNNREKYRMAFDGLEISGTPDCETIRAAAVQRIRNRRIRAAVLPVLLAFLFTAEYHADAQFREVIREWTQGTSRHVVQTEAEKGITETEVVMKDGTVIRIMSSGDTSQKMMESFLDTIAFVGVNDRGRVMLYYQDQTGDITPYFKPLDQEIILSYDNGETGTVFLRDYAYVKFLDVHYCIGHIENAETGFDYYQIFSRGEYCSVPGKGMVSCAFLPGEIGGYIFPSYADYLRD
ncbi:MAG: hypothetical protein IJ130_09025 [Solobacterium sp.]|nr:hypothetical protein [Solobacterium sp.]